MLDTYAAWTEGAQESDVEAIRVAMAGAPERVPQSLPAIVSAEVPKTAPVSPLGAPEFGSSLAVEHPRVRVSTCSTKRNDGGERGIRTLEGLLTLTPLAGVRLRPLGHLSVNA